MTTYQLPEPVTDVIVITGPSTHKHMKAGQHYYTAKQMHQAFAAGAASRDAEIEALRADALRYRWMRDNNCSYLYRDAWFNAVVTDSGGPCDIFSKAEAVTLVEAEIDRRIAIDAAIAAEGDTP